MEIKATWIKNLADPNVGGPVLLGGCILFGIILFIVIGCSCSNKPISEDQAKHLQQVYNDYPELRKEIIEIKKDGITRSEYKAVVSKMQDINTQRAVEAIGYGS